MLKITDSDDKIYEIPENQLHNLLDHAKHHGLDMKNPVQSLIHAHEKSVYAEPRMDPITFFESDGVTERRLEWDSGDDSVGIQAGYEPADDFNLEEVWGLMLELMELASLAINGIPTGTRREEATDSVLKSMAILPENKLKKFIKMTADKFKNIDFGVE